MQNGLPASVAAAVTAAKTSAVSTTTVAICFRASFIDGKRSSAEFFAVGRIDSGLHVFFGKFNESETFVANDSNFGYRAVWLKKLSDIILCGIVRHIAYVKCFVGQLIAILLGLSQRFQRKAHDK